MQKISISIVGAGRVGQTLGYFLHRSSDYYIAAISTQHKSSAQKAARFIGHNVIPYTNPIKAAKGSQIVFITTPDRYIEQICQQLVQAKAISSNTTVIHCSGNYTSDILFSAKQVGARIASLHPLQTFAAAYETIRYFPGTYCVYEGDKSTHQELIRIIKSIRGIPIKIDKSVKPLYHTAGVFASNYLVTLIYASINFLIRSGFTSSTALRAIMPLVEGTVKNIRKVGILEALTGPISRGDFSTLQEHLKKIKRNLPSYLPLYKILGKYTLKVAQEKGSISQILSKKIKQLLTEQNK